MRFMSSTKPSLTPLGHRLLSLSEMKLSNLEPGVGGRDVGLWRGVVVREAVKMAWQSVDQGSVGEMNDWHGANAMGLDVIGEEEEEEEVSEERWFEDLMSTFGEEVEYHEWESNVAGAFEDFEDVYDEEGMQAYTLPKSPSPTFRPVDQPISVVVVEVDPEQPAQPILTPLAHPITPLYTPDSPISPLSLYPDLDDLDNCAEDFLLPPPLVRSMSSSSTSSLPDDEDDPCVTPPSYSHELAESCEDLEEEAPRLQSGFAMTRKAFGKGWLGLDFEERLPGVLI